MPVYGNPNVRRKYDAFLVVDQSGHEPLKEAIQTALQMRQSAQKLREAYERCIDPETKSQLALSLARALPDEFHAWIKIAEFIYAKPKQALELSGSVTLEQVLAASWEKHPAIEA